MEGLTNVKSVNAGSCEGEVNIPGKEAVMDPEEETTKRTKHTKEQAGGMQNKEKIWVRGTLQKSAVPCGFRECGVEIAECSRKWLADGANVDCGGTENILKRFREKPGKSGIPSTCARLNGVKKNPDG